MRRCAVCLALVLAGGAAIPAGAQETAYTVTLEGVADDPLRTLLRDVSRLVSLQKEPPPSPVGLRRRAEADRERLQAALRSEGFYDSTVTLAVDTDTAPATVAVTVNPGRRYVLGSVMAVGADGAGLPGPALDAAALGLEPGAPARSPAVQDAGDRIAGILARRGHAFARLTDLQATVDHATGRMDVVYVVAPGPLVRFGEPRITGLEDVETGAVRRRLRFAPGEAYDPTKMEASREALVGLDVFSAVRLRLDADDAPAGAGEATVPVTVALSERPQRFVGFGFDYGTRDGFGANAYWGHRNLLGGAERFRIGAQVAGIGRSDLTDPGEFDYRLGATFLERDFLRARQNLTLSAEALSERPDAYRRNALVASAIVERPIAKGLTASLGVTLEQSEVTGATRTVRDARGLRLERESSSNTLFGVPAVITFDRTDDPLDASRGFKLSAAATPYVAALGDSSSFTVARIAGSTYWRLSEPLVAALRGTYGAIVGDGFFDVPADKRFYAGGGGSIRGFGYQEVGPKDAVGDPRGGLSLLELSAELRYRLGDNLGLVAFVDAGNVYVAEYPQPSDGLRWAAGVGARYFTAVGPIRVDVGVPLDRRDGEGSWALYVSLGQAF